MRAEQVLDCANLHGEGVLWNPADEKLWWTDIHGRKLWSYEPVTGQAACFDMPGRVCCFAPRAQGGFIVAFDDRISLFSLERGETQRLYDFEPDNPATRLNDGRTDRRGRFIAGGMNEATGAADSSVVSVDEQLQVRVLFDGVSCANSTCFSADGRSLFFADTPTRELCVFDYDEAAGSVSNRRVLAAFADQPGLPDGSCVDADGAVWNAQWEGHRVVRVTPDGNIDRVIEVPVWKPTCCAFGGANLDTLYITTSRLGSSPAQLADEPASGGLFCVRPGVRGVPDSPFRG